MSHEILGTCYTKKIFLVYLKFRFDLCFFFFINLFIFTYLLFLAVFGFFAVRRLSLVAASGGYSSLWCTCFSLRWLLLLQGTGSRTRRL